MASSLEQAGYELTDFSAHQLDLGDGYPYPMIPVARSVDAANHAVAGTSLGKVFAQMAHGAGIAPHLAASN
jgi:hypothetical protein